MVNIIELVSFGTLCAFRWDFASLNKNYILYAVSYSQTGGYTTTVLLLGHYHSPVAFVLTILHPSHVNHEI